MRNIDRHKVSVEDELMNWQTHQIKGSPILVNQSKVLLRKLSADHISASSMFTAEGNITILFCTVDESFSFCPLRLCSHNYFQLGLIV